MVQKNWRSRIFKKKNFLAKNGEKGVKNMRFRARLGNQTIDFSDFWYVTSLIYYFKYGIGSFARKNFFGPKNGEKGVKNALLTDILVDKAYLVTFEL